MGKILENIKKRRQAILAERRKEQEIARKAFRSAKYGAIREREKRRAKVKYGKTRGEKLQDAMANISAMSGTAPRPTTTKKKTGKKKTKARAKPKAKSVTFDLGNFDDLGDLDDIFDDDLF